MFRERGGFFLSGAEDAEIQRDHEGAAAGPETPRRVVPFLSGYVVRQSV